MGAFLDPANEYLNGELNSDEFRSELIENLKLASVDQLGQLAKLLIKDVSAK